MEKWSLMTLTVLLALTVRWAVSLGSYSGKAPAQAAAAPGTRLMGLGGKAKQFCLLLISFFGVYIKSYIGRNVLFRLLLYFSSS